MDLRYRGASDLARVFVRTYAEARGDRELPALLPVLCNYRAMVRAKVAMLAAAERELPAADRDGARQSAWRHLMLAAAYAAEERGPRWIVVCGPPASGKSRLCAELAGAAHWPQLATDRVRKELAGVDPTARARAEHYTAEFSQRTYAELLARAAMLTRRGERVVLLDGNFPTPAHRTAAVAAARTAGAEVLTVHVDVDVDTAVARAAARAHDPANVSDADAAVTAARRARFVAPAANEVPRLLRVDGARPPRDHVPVVLLELLRGPHDGRG
jgi:predicted kinase